MIKKRLFTFGCSFTKFNWPTWADILGKEFLFFYNWGYPGIGNRAIAERLAEAHTVHDINKDDIVIIQWSSHIRHDYARLDLVDHLHGMWRTKGNIFSEWNSEIFDNKWIENFWYEKNYYIHTLNNILMSQKFLDSIGCTWYMTSMNDLENLHDPNFKYQENEPGKTFNVWDLSPDLVPYKEKIWDQYKDKWLPNILQEKHNTPELDWWFPTDSGSNFSVFKKKDSKFKEPHPTYRQYYNYLIKNKIYDILEISNTQDKLTNIDIEVYNQMKEESANYLEFMDRICQTEWALTSRTMGR